MATAVFQVRSVFCERGKELLPVWYLSSWLSQVLAVLCSVSQQALRIEDLLDWMGDRESFKCSQMYVFSGMYLTWHRWCNVVVWVGRFYCTVCERFIVLFLQMHLCSRHSVYVHVYQYECVWKSDYSRISVRMFAQYTGLLLLYIHWMTGMWKSEQARKR